jgi:hypothetical protein
VSAHWWFSLEDLVELRRLTDEAFELRETGYLHDACVAIVAWAERTDVDRLERLVMLAKEHGRL